MTIILTVQGNIAAGKSTFVESLRQQYEGNSRVCFLQEPVDEWSTITDEEGKTMLALFYGNQKRYAFSFQMMAYISRLALLKRAIAKNYDIIITERSLETDRQIFAKMLYNDGKIASVEYQIYLKWFDEFKRDFPEENVIYVKTDPEISAQRVTKRGREGEIIPLEYLQKCHDYHLFSIDSNSAYRNHPGRKHLRRFGWIWTVFPDVPSRQSSKPLTNQTAVTQ